MGEGITIIFSVITFVIILIYSLFRKRDIKKIIRQEIEDAIRYKYIPIKEIKTDRNLLDSPKGNTNNNDTCNYSNNHFIIYGASGTGKTYWLKKNYLEKFNIDYRIYSSHTDEWDSIKIISNLNEINQLNNVTIILDDVENEIKNCKLINDLFLNGRHRNIQCIIIAHTTKIISNQIRQNISNILITTNNTTYGINHPIEEIIEEHGMILYEVKKRKITFADKDGNIKEEKDRDIIKYLNQYEFDDEEKLEIKDFIESTSSQDINISLHLIPFYKVIYFKSLGYKQNNEKIKNIYSGNENFSDVYRYGEKIPKLQIKVDKTLGTIHSINNKINLKKS